MAEKGPETFFVYLFLVWFRRSSDKNSIYLDSEFGKQNLIFPSPSHINLNMKMHNFFDFAEYFWRFGWETLIKPGNSVRLRVA